MEYMAPEFPARCGADRSSVSYTARGEFIVVLDSPHRENEGDLIIAARYLTPAKAAFMIRHTSGLICAPLPAHLADSLNLPQMVPDNQDPNRTAYTVSVDANDPSLSTGISAYDRSLTCRSLADANAEAPWFRRPGHVFPLRARDGGVRERRGHTEAAVEFCRLANAGQVGVICELVEDGEDDAEGRSQRAKAGMMRRDGCLRFARKWDLRICTIETLVDWLDSSDGAVAKKAAAISNGHT